MQRYAPHLATRASLIRRPIDLLASATPICMAEKARTGCADAGPTSLALMVAARPDDSGPGQARIDAESLDVSSIERTLHYAA